MKDQGNKIELQFLMRCFDLGLMVSLPYGDNAAYDFIVDNKGKLTRVQVKSTNRINSANRNYGYHLSCSHGTNSKILYTVAEIDLLVGCVIELDTWYLIPIQQLKSKNIRLYPHNPSVKGKFEEYKNRWDLL